MITLEMLKLMSPAERRNLRTNAERKGTPEALAIVELIEGSGLACSADEAVRLDDAIGRAMHRVIFSSEGKAAAAEAVARGMPPLGSVDPMLQKALGKVYGAHNEATVQAGYLVTNLMRQLGFERSGSAPLPEGCLAKSGALFVRVSRPSPHLKI